MATQFTRVRQIDTRDKKNKFARKEANDTIHQISEYCKKICIGLIQKIVNLLKYIYRYAISCFTFTPRVHVRREEEYYQKPLFSMREKASPGLYKLDELYESRDKVFNVYRQMHENIIKKFHSRDYYGCITACNEYINELNSPAYMNHVRATKCKKEMDTLLIMMNDAMKYSSQALMLA
jgi:hypothetical protein